MTRMTNDDATNTTAAASAGSTRDAGIFTPGDAPLPSSASPGGGHDNKKEEEDEEGLAREYDVILYGTGLVESIVASALARAGKSVLHCDASDYYGSLDAVWTLPFVRETLSKEGRDFKHNAPGESTTIPLVSNPDSVIQVHSMQRLQDYSIATPGTLVWTPSGQARVESVQLLPSSTAAPSVQITLSLTSWTLANGAHPRMYLGIPWTHLKQGQPQLADDPATLTTDELQSAVDRHYRLGKQTDRDAEGNQKHRSGLCSIQSWHERIDDEMLERQGRRSFALDASPGLLLAWGPAVEGLLQSGVADYVEFKSLEKVLYAQSSTLQPVPCSKNDVFASTLLRPMEKRRLMKFLQLALDYALLTAETEEAAEQQQQQGDGGGGGEEAVTSWNERHLNQGRSLARPQNKAVNTNEMATLQECMAEGALDFETYLVKHFNLSPSLVSLVRYALALEPIYEGGADSALSLQRGMQRLCRHVRALGRFGTTAFLVPLYGSGELSQSFCRSAAVYGATYLLRRRLAGIATDDGKSVRGVDLLPAESEDDSTERAAIAGPTKRIACQHVVVSEHAVKSFLQTGSTNTHRRVLRRISIVRGKPMVDQPDQQQRLGIVIPPYNDGHKYTIHGLVLDESVNVAPFRSFRREPQTPGCSVVHFSTVIDVEDESAPVEDAFMKQALETILSQSAKKSDADRCQEIFHVSFSVPLYDHDATNQLPNGLHVVHRPAPGLVLDTAFEQAKEIFAQICPQHEFLVLAKEIDTMVKERFGEGGNANEDDDEKRVLESAMDMIDDKQKPSSEKAQAEPPRDDHLI